MIDTYEFKLDIRGKKTGCKNELIDATCGTNLYQILTAADNCGFRFAVVDRTPIIGGENVTVALDVDTMAYKKFKGLALDERGGFETFLDFEAACSERGVML